MAAELLLHQANGARLERALARFDIDLLDGRDPLVGVRVAAASTGNGVTTDADLLWVDDVSDVNTERPVAGDTYVVEFTAMDDKLAVLDQGKGLGNSQANVLGSGPMFMGAVMLSLELLGASVPSYISAAAAEPFGIGSPHMGGGGQGHAGAMLISAALTDVRDAVAAYTVPT